MTTKKPVPEVAGVPDSFWTQPEQMIKDESISLIYAEIKAQFEKELKDRNSGILDYMLAERTASLYGNIRQRETTNSFANDRNRKETLQLWVQLATTLKKQWQAEDSDKVAETVAHKVTAAMTKALESVPEALRKEVSDELQKQLVEVGL